MFEMPKTGMWAILNEECVIPKGTDKGFTEKLHDAHKKSVVITTVKGVSPEGKIWRLTGAPRVI